MDMMGRIPDVILTLAFGFPPDLKMNKLLARETEKVVMKLKVPAFIERDIPVDLDIISMAGEKIEIYGRNIPAYLPCLKIMISFRDWWMKNDEGWQSVLLLVAPPYRKRCIRDLKRVMPDIIVLIEPFEFIDRGFWFSSSSSQWWTRSRWPWMFREVLISILPWKVYEWLSLRK